MSGHEAGWWVQRSGLRGGAASELTGLGFLPGSCCVGFPDGSAGKESTCDVGDLGSIPGLGRSPGEGKGYALPVFWPGEFHGQYSPWGRKESDTTEQLSLHYI